VGLRDSGCVISAVCRLRHPRLAFVSIAIAFRTLMGCVAFFAIGINWSAQAWATHSGGLHRLWEAISGP